MSIRAGQIQQQLVTEPIGRSRTDHLHAVIAGAIGNGLEWFNFGAYVLYAAIIARQFFPAANPLNSLLASLATFSLGFFARPLGGIVLGMYSDRVGRKAAMSASILTMCVGTALIALTPNYAAIGIAAPLLILLGRLFQGFSAGGEYGSSAAYMREFAPPGREGFYVSWLYSSTSLCNALGVLIGTIVSLVLGTAALESWGWRLPFFFGLLIGPVGYIMRRRLAEVPSHRRSSDPGAIPLIEVFTKHLGKAIASVGLITLATICSYVLLAYTPIYSVHALHLPQTSGFIATLAGLLTTGGMIPVWGLLIDRVGPRLLMRISAILLIVLAYPMFRFITTEPTLTHLLMFQILFGVIIALYQGPLLTGMSDLFPSQTLATGLGIADSVAVALFGGTAALIITYLIAVTGSPMVPAFYVMAAALVGLISTIPLPR